MRSRPSSNSRQRPATAALQRQLGLRSPRVRRFTWLLCRDSFRGRVCFFTDGGGWSAKPQQARWFQSLRAASSVCPEWSRIIRLPILNFNRCLWRECAGANGSGARPQTTITAHA